MKEHISPKELSREVLAVLFYKNDEMSVSELATLLGTDKDLIRAALEHVTQSLENIGIVLVTNGDRYSLSTSSDLGGLIERMVKEELNRDLSPASLETLSIIVYKGTVTRREIEYIRGVNSSFSLRALLMRGLIERESSTLDERIFLYKPSTDTLRYLGVTSIEELPEWKSVGAEIKKVQEHQVTDEPAE